MKTNDDHFSFQGCTQYLERKQRVNAIKQMELENEQLQLKSNLLKFDKPRMSSRRGRLSNKHSAKFDKADLNSLHSPKHKADIESSEAFNGNSNQPSHFAKERKYSVVDKPDQNQDNKQGKKIKRIKQKQPMQTHRVIDANKNPNLAHDPSAENANYDTTKSFVDQKENINKNKNIDYLLRLTNSETKNKNSSMHKDNLKSVSPTSRNQKLVNYKSQVPNERLYKKVEQNERTRRKPKDDHTFFMNSPKYSGQEMYSIYDASGTQKDDKKYKMPSVFRNPKGTNKSKDTSNRNLMTPKVMKHSKHKKSSGRVMSSSPEYNRVGRNGSTTSPNSSKKLNSHLSSQQIRFQDEMNISKGHKVAVYLTKVKPYFYLPKVDAHRSKLRVMKRTDKLGHSDNKINIESVNEYSKESLEGIDN